MGLRGSGSSSPAPHRCHHWVEDFGELQEEGRCFQSNGVVKWTASWLQNENTRPSMQWWAQWDSNITEAQEFETPDPYPLSTAFLFIHPGKAYATFTYLCP